MEKVFLVLGKRLPHGINILNVYMFMAAFVESGEVQPMQWYEQVSCQIFRQPLITHRCGKHPRFHGPWLRRP
jgi:hypothetical protein